MRINRMLTRRQFSGLSVVLLASVSQARNAFAASELAIDPTPDDCLGAKISEAMSRGITRFRLLDGAYGPQTLKNINGQTIEILGSPGTVVDMVMIQSCSNLFFRDVSFRGEKSERGQGNGLVYIAKSSSHIAFEGCSFSTVADAQSWSAADWVQKPYVSGLLARGPNVDVSKCHFFNLRNCVTLLGDDSSIRDSQFTDFGNDGIEFGANNLAIFKNSIIGSRHTATEPMHSDGIQGFPAPDHSTYSNIEIRGNHVEFAGPGDYMQGISIFDGRWRNVRIIDNTVRINIWNAIAIYGVDTINIEGNTVSSTDPKIRNWIEVRAAKDGTISTGVVLKNNNAPEFRVSKDAMFTGNTVNKQ